MLSLHLPILFPIVFGFCRTRPLRTVHPGVSSSFRMNGLGYLSALVWTNELFELELQGLNGATWRCIELRGLEPSGVGDPFDDW